ncbi:MAG: aldo/keto reductase [Rubrivivax sp.]
MGIGTPAPRTLAWPDGRQRPAIGLGTWRYGESAGTRRAELAALREAFEIGWRAIDTAEMYADGGAETVVGEALGDALRGGLSRDEFFVVSKAYPQHGDRRGLQQACERSRRRLGLDRIDLYLLHWRGHVPLAETVQGMQQLQRRGWIGQWGVSNFDVDDLAELAREEGGATCATNQVWHSLGQRGVEFELLPWMRARGWPLMAYCPIDQGALAASRQAALREVADKHRATPAQVALAALLALDGVMPIPKAVCSRHLHDNWAAQFIALDADDRARLDRAFPPPQRREPLAMT